MFDFFRRRHRSILLISLDRDPAIENASFLAQTKLRIMHAEPDRQAVELARRNQPRLIIETATDDAEADAEFRRGLAARASTRSIPLILLLPEGEAEDASLATGADAIISFPMDPGELFDAVRSFLPLPSRKTPRVDANLRFRFRAEGPFLQAFSRDLSQRGVSLHTDRQFELGAKLELEFHIPGFDGPIRCSGLVRSTTGELGIEFAELCPEDERRLNYFITAHRPAD